MSDERKQWGDREHLPGPVWVGVDCGDQDCSHEGCYFAEGKAERQRLRAEAAESALLEMRKLADERVAAACAADHRALAAESALAELRAKVEAWQRTAQQAHYEHGGVDWDALDALLGPR